MPFSAGTTYNVAMPLTSSWASGVEFRAVVTEEINIFTNQSRFSVLFQYKGNIQNLSSDTFSKFCFGINKNSFNLAEQTFLPADYSNSASWTTIETPIIAGLNEVFYHLANGGGTYELTAYVYTRGRYLGSVKYEKSPTVSVEHGFTPIDRSLPTISAVVSNVTAAGTATITATASHSAYSVTEIEITVNGQTYSSSAAAQNPLTFAVNLTGLAEGQSYSYRIIAFCENNTQKATTGTISVPQGVTGVSLSPSSVEMTVGDERSLTYSVTPLNAANRAVSFSSSNQNIATVNSSGVVTAVGAGNATITITTADGGYTDTCAVTAVAAPILITRVDLHSTDFSLKIGESVTVYAYVYPWNASNKNRIWTSSNPSLVTVTKVDEESAIVKAVSLSGETGTVTITVTTEEGNKTDSVVATVYAENTEYSETSRLTAEMLCGFFNNCAYFKQALSAKGISVSLNSPISNLKGRNTSPLDISYACTRTENNCRAIKTALSSTTDFAALSVQYIWTGKNRTWQKGVNDWIAFFDELAEIVDGTEPLKGFLTDCNGEEIKAFDNQHNSEFILINKGQFWNDL